jgi:hypothetical protein
MNENTMRAKRAMQALRASSQKNTGRVSGGLGAAATDRLADLDACTLTYRTWSPLLVPGLLQTPAYAGGAIRSHTPEMDIAELGHMVTRRRRRSEAFLARRAALMEPRPELAWFLIGETAIRRPLMNAHSHADQLRHLLEISRDYGNVIIQVMPVDSPIPVTAEPFSLFHMDPGPTVVHLETLIGGWYSVTSEDIARTRSAFSDMVGRAMSTRESRDFISEELHTCWGHSAEPTSSNPPTQTRTTASTSPDLPPAPSE